MSSTRLEESMPGLPKTGRDGGQRHLFFGRRAEPQVSARLLRIYAFLQTRNSFLGLPGQNCAVSTLGEHLKLATCFGVADFFQDGDAI